MPGQSLSLSHNLGSFTCDPAFFDLHNLDFQTDFKGCSILYRIEGVCGHDTAADQQGILPAGIDIVAEMKYVIEYDAGTDLNDFSVSDSSDTMTTAAVISSKPVSDNIGYSVV